MKNIYNLYTRIIKNRNYRIICYQKARQMDIFNRQLISEINNKKKKFFWEIFINFR